MNMTIIHINDFSEIIKNSPFMQYFQKKDVIEYAERNKYHCYNYLFRLYEKGQISIFIGKRGNGYNIIFNFVRKKCVLIVIGTQCHRKDTIIRLYEYLNASNGNDFSNILQHWSRFPDLFRLQNEYLKFGFKDIKLVQTQEHITDESNFRKLLDTLREWLNKIKPLGFEFEYK